MEISEQLLNIIVRHTWLFCVNICSDAIKSNKGKLRKRNAYKQCVKELFVR